MQFFFSEVSQNFSETHRLVFCSESKQLEGIYIDRLIPFTLSLAFTILLILVFAILNFFLLFKWLSMVTTSDLVFNTADMIVWKYQSFFLRKKKEMKYHTMLFVRPPWSALSLEEFKSLTWLCRMLLQLSFQWRSFDSLSTWASTC